MPNHKLSRNDYPTRIPAYEDGTDRVFRNVGIYKQTPGNYPKENTLYHF